MANLVNNPLLLISTSGTLQVMDSYGNFPYDPVVNGCRAYVGSCDILGGNGVAPDNWWFLGGPNFGTFANAGAVWDTRQTPGGGRSILLDIANSLVAQSGGVTQVIPINQTEIKPIRVSAYVAAESCTGNPKVTVSFIGYPPGTPAAGGGSLVFDTGTYDFTTKKATFIPSEPVKYIFIHCLHRGFSAGKAWYGQFNLEELNMTPVTLPPGNNTINPNFSYSGDDVTPTGWDVSGATLSEETSPLGVNSMLLQRNSSITQKNICINTGLLKQKITVYAMGPTVAIFKVKVTLLNRYRRIIGEKTVDIQATSQWKATDIFVLSTVFTEKADIEIVNIDGDSGFIGGVLLTSQAFTPSKIVDIVPTIRTINVPAVSADTTSTVSIDQAVKPKHIKFNFDTPNNIIRLTNGLMGDFAAEAVHEPFTLLKKTTMTQLSSTEYTLSPWPSSISGIEVDLQKIDQYLRIPHIVHPDMWQLTTGGSIPASDTRYYCVTALTSYGETDQSNVIRAITDANSNTNRVPIEITPVEGASAYRVYMTQNEDADQPWEYSSAKVKKLIWDDGQNHLVAEVTSAQLRDGGYIVYDTGAALSAGYPPTGNTAKRWTVDNVNQKVVFDAASTPAEAVQAVYPVTENSNAILYLSHANKFYIAGDAGIYESDIFTPGELTLTTEALNIVALSHYNELWYMTTAGDVKNIAVTTYPGDVGFIAFCFVDSVHIARITAAGTVKIFDLAGVVASQFTLDGITDCSGLAGYFDKLVTYNNQQKKFVVFDLSGQIIQSINLPITGILAWNISGSHLVIKTSFTTVVYRIYANKYYAKLDQGYYLDDTIQYPSIVRAKLPGEVTPPVYPELLPNGTFEDGTTFPSGFTIYGPTEIEAGFSTEVAVPGTKAIYFHFPYRDWKSINKYGVTVVGGRQYCFSAYAKATVTGTGRLGIKFLDRDGLGTEVFYDVVFGTSYELKQTIVQAPIDAVSVDLRYLAYGDYTQGVTYLLNNLSLKEQAASDVTLEHVFNGDFSIAPTGATIPSGWEMDGDGEDVAITEVIPATMQAKGKGLKITLPTYEQAGWTVLQSQAFEVSEGDTLEVSFYYRRDKALSISIQVSIYHINPDGSWGPAEHIDVSVANPTNASVIRAVFSPIQAGYPKARLRIWPEFDDSNYIEMCSIVPIVETNLVVNPKFTDGLTSWTARGKDMSGAYVTGLGVSVESAFSHSAPNCCKLTVDGTTNTYAEVRQTIYLNQTAPKKITFGAWATGDYLGGYAILEIYIKFMDGTSLWNPFGVSQRWPTGFFAWQELSFEYTPDKAIQYIILIPNLGHAAVGSAWVDDVSLEGERDESAFDGIALTIPYAELNTNTIKQVKLSAQLTLSGNPVATKNVNITFEASPDLGSFVSLPTNDAGRAVSVYTLPEQAGQVTLKAKYEGLESSGIINIYPLVSNQEIIVEDFPQSMDTVNMEIIVPRDRKPLPDVTERIGRWEVFRSTIFNAKQMLDYDVHFSPDTNTRRWPDLNPSLISKIYTRLIFLDYFDDLSDYPRHTNWQEIMAQRKEWFAMDSVGFSAPFGDDRYYFNWRNMEAIQWYVDRILRDRKSWGDGIYVDDFKGEAYNVFIDYDWETKASQLISFRNVKERIETSAERLKLLRSELQKRGKYLTSNFGCARKKDVSGNLSVDTSLLGGHFDGFLIEVWLYRWEMNPVDVTDASFTTDHVRYEIDFIKWSGENNKFIACLAHSRSDLYPARIFCLAAFLMGKHKNAYYSHMDWEEWYAYGSYWHTEIQPECAIETGQPLEDYQLVDGLFSRQFENCVALLNMNDAAQDYTLPAGIWYTMRGESYSGTISVTRRQGLVLVKERP